jgi:hypothetical protein
MKLTKAQEKVIRGVIEFHRAGMVASFHTDSMHQWDARPIKFLIKHGLLKRLTDRDVYDFDYTCVIPHHYFLEMTTAGWDHVYKVG